MVKQLFQLFLSFSPAIFLSHTSLSTFNLPPPLDSHFICALCFARLTLAFHSLSLSLSLARSSFSLHLSKCFFFSSASSCASRSRDSSLAGRQYFAVNVHLATFHLLLPAFPVILSSRSRHELLTPTHTGQVTAECCLCLSSLLCICVEERLSEREESELLFYLSSHHTILGHLYMHSFLPSFQYTALVSVQLWAISNGK